MLKNNEKQSVIHMHTIFENSRFWHLRIWKKLRKVNFPKKQDRKCYDFLMVI